MIILFASVFYVLTLASKPGGAAWFRAGAGVPCPHHGSWIRMTTNPAARTTTGAVVSLCCGLGGGVLLGREPRILTSSMSACSLSVVRGKDGGVAPHTVAMLVFLGCCTGS